MPPTSAQRRHGRLRDLLLPAVAILLVAGCVSQNVEEIGSEERADPQAPARTETRAEPDDGADAPSSWSPESAGETSGRVRVIVELDPSLAGQVPSDATLFLIARVAGREGGPPVAVQRVGSFDLPQEFVISEEDAMISGTPLGDEIDVEARIDQDGGATTRTPGDLHGRVEGVAVGGEEPVTLVLDQRHDGESGR